MIIQRKIIAQVEISEQQQFLPKDLLEALDSVYEYEPKIKRLIANNSLEELKDYMRWVGG